MKPNDKKKFAAALGTLSVVFKEEITPALIKIYFTALKGFDIFQVQDAISKAIVSCRFFPKPVELIEFIKGNQGQIESQGLKIAHQIVAHIKAHGSRERPNLTANPIANELMSTRWPYYSWAAQVTEDELKWWVKEFTEAYSAYSSVEAVKAIEGSPEVKKLTEGMFERI